MFCWLSNKKAFLAFSFLKPEFKVVCKLPAAFSQASSFAYVELAKLLVDLTKLSPSDFLAYVLNVANKLSTSVWWISNIQ